MALCSFDNGGGEPPRDDDDVGGDARPRLLIGIGRVPDILVIILETLQNRSVTHTHSGRWQTRATKRSMRKTATTQRESTDAFGASERTEAASTKRKRSRKKTRLKHLDYTDLCWFGLLSTYPSDTLRDKIFTEAASEWESGAK